jgi:hypothetical protein
VRELAEQVVRKKERWKQSDFERNPKKIEICVFLLLLSLMCME